MDEKQIYDYPVRVCRTMHQCCVCELTITDGQHYYDGGIRKRCHIKCAPPIFIDKKANEGRIKTLRKYLGMLLNRHNDVPGELIDAINDRIERIKKRGSVMATEWISVEDRRPDKKGLYLCHCPDTEYKEDCKIRIVSFGYVFKNRFAPAYVTHWMPLPEIPK